MACKDAKCMHGSKRSGVQIQSGKSDYRLIKEYSFMLKVQLSLAVMV